MDARAFAAGVSEDALMERAARHLARAVVDLAGRAYGLRVALLCGTGGNGGDGLAAARLLVDRGAAPVTWLVGEPAAEGVTGRMAARWRRAGGRETATAEEALDGADIAVDCLLGTGVRGEPREPHAAAIAALSAYGGLVVACDLPSGVDADTGRVPGVAVRADLTLTLGARKRGLALWPARGNVGTERLGELGIVTDDDVPVASVLEAADVAALIPQLPPDAHKRTRGVVVALAGSPGMAGAAVMVARGAMAAGAGYVAIATGDPELVTATVPEAVTARVDPRDPATVEAVLGLCEHADALAVGPGLGHDDATAAVVRRLVREAALPLVLDADGLNAFSGDGDALADHASPLLVCTPHARELARLVGSSGHGVWAQRLELVPELARRWGAVIVAKGPGTVVAAGDGRVWINPAATAALGTAGTGDVLTGVTAALVGQRPQPDSVAAAVALHGLAGERAAAASHARSVTALDVAAAVPLALRALDVERNA